MIYTGDWNELDNRSYLHVNNPKAREVIKNRMASDGLVDVKQPTSKGLHLVSGWF